MNPPPLVLASGSASRRRILESAGIRFEVVVSDVEESWDAADPPEVVVAALAEAKADAVAERRPDAAVLGCDSLFVLDGAALGKPHTPRVALDRWRAMAGRPGTLMTGHVLVAGGVRHTEVVATTVRIGRPSEKELAAYVRSGEPLEVAGAFTLEGRSAAFIDGVDGDAANVQGLSVAALRRLLGAAGYGIDEYWI